MRSEGTLSERRDSLACYSKQNRFPRIKLIEILESTLGTIYTSGRE